MCLGDCLSGSGAGEGEIREGSRKGRRGLWEAGMALSEWEEVQLGSRDLPGTGWKEEWLSVSRASPSWKL